MAEMEFMGFTNMTMTDIENVLNQYNKEKEASAGYREKYRKTAKGRVAHNRANRRTYLKKKLGELPTDNLTQKQIKQKKKWTDALVETEN